MSNRRGFVDWSVVADSSWLHWAATVPLLGFHLAGQRWALPAAVVLCALMAVCYAILVRGFKPMPAQVRFAYLGLLAVGALPGLYWIHWIQLFGASAMVVVGYCPLVRLLSLLPLNRTEPLTGRVIWRTLVTDPCSGGLLHRSSKGVATTETALACSCSIRAGRSEMA